LVVVIYKPSGRLPSMPAQSRDSCSRSHRARLGNYHQYQRAASILLLPRLLGIQAQGAPSVSKNFGSSGSGRMQQLLARQTFNRRGLFSVCVLLVVVMVGVTRCRKVEYGNSTVSFIVPLFKHVHTTNCLSHPPIYDYDYSQWDTCNYLRDFDNSSRPGVDPGRNCRRRPSSI
jgi:hypothetical protein